ncbi:MAG: FtsQ-type POTRA domain-containing protein [Actinomycetota bacterium]|nr:MAG: FtsQ-type POTRA domain-containing protein [Actinomycetota bacterium]
MNAPAGPARAVAVGTAPHRQDTAAGGSPSGSVSGPSRRGRRVLSRLRLRLRLGGSGGGRRRRRTAVVAGVVLAALLLIGGWLVGFSGVLALRTVTVQGASEATMTAVRDAVADEVGRPLLRVDTAAVQSRIAAIPLVATATVTRSWPDSVIVVVTERIAVAVVGDATGGFRVVDATGVTLRTTASRPSDLLFVKDVTEPAALAAAVAVAATLPADLAGQVIAISATSPDAVSLKLSGGAVVRWGSAERPELKAAVLAALLPRHATTYDVSAPELPTTSGG